MAPTVKHLVFRHYTWLATAGILAAVTYVGLDGNATNWAAVATGTGVVLSSIFFIQKQKLEELRLFQTLFREFNARYDEMNERLTEVRETFGSDPSPADRDFLVDYFNLCGEEYLYYSAGYIPPEVWRAWQNGMLWFRKNEHIKRFWDQELGTDSYYGLRFDGR